MNTNLSWLSLGFVPVVTTYRRGMRYGQQRSRAKEGGKTVSNCSMMMIYTQEKYCSINNKKAS